jgi:transcription antitermination factor NusG
LAWHVAQTNGHEWKACFYLRKAGIRCFWAVEHVYYIDARTKQEKFRIRALFPKYVFVELLNADERDAAREAIGVARLLGWMTEGGFKLATIPDHSVTDLMDAGPPAINKRKEQKKPKRGDKVKIAIKGINEILATFSSVDNSGKYVVVASMLGSETPIHVRPEDVSVIE